MTLKKFLNLQKLKSIISNLKNKNPEIWDVCIYGSIIRGKTSIRDIDFAIILKSGLKVSKKLELAQELKHELKKSLDYEIDVKSIDMNDLKDPSFMARQGILAEGYLISQKEHTARLFGFDTHSIFIFNLKGLSASQKTMFRYALNGRRGSKGILKPKGCEHLGSGVIKVPIRHSEEFKEFLENFKIDYKIQKGVFY